MKTTRPATLLLSDGSSVQPPRRAKGRKPKAAAVASGQNGSPTDESMILETKSATPASHLEEAALEVLLPKPPEPVGSVRMDVTALTPGDLDILLHRIEHAMEGNAHYAGLEDQRLRLLKAGAALRGRLDRMTALDIEWKANRAALDLDLQEGRDALRQAAKACEAVNPSVGALVSAGWDLRRRSGPAQQLPAPAALRSQTTAFPGQAVIRWNSVPNAHAYELQICPVGIPGFLDSSPSRHLFQVKTVLTGQAPGSTHRCRVRALGAKGPSPWSPMISVRVG